MLKNTHCRIICSIGPQLQTVGELFSNVFLTLVQNKIKIDPLKQSVCRLSESADSEGNCNYINLRTKLMLHERCHHTVLIVYK